MTAKELDQLICYQILRNEIRDSVQLLNPSVMQEGIERLKTEGFLMDTSFERDLQSLHSKKGFEAITILFYPEEGKKKAVMASLWIQPGEDRFLNQIRCSCTDFRRKNSCVHTVASVQLVAGVLDRLLNEKKAEEVFTKLDLKPSKITGLLFQRPLFSPYQLAKKLKANAPKKAVAVEQPAIPGTKDFIFNDAFNDWKVLNSYFSYRQEVNQQLKLKPSLVTLEEGRVWEFTNSTPFTSRAEMVGNNTFRVTNSHYGSHPREGLVHMLALLLAMTEKVSYYWHRRFNDHTEEKAAVMAMYGVKPTDAIAYQFVFSTDMKGNLSLDSMPKGLLNKEQFQKLNQQILQNLVDEPYNESALVKDSNATIQLTYGICFNLALKPWDDLFIEGISFKIKKTGGFSPGRFSLRAESDVKKFAHLDPALYDGLRKVTWQFAFQSRYFIPSQIDLLTMSGSSRESWISTMRDALQVMAPQLETFENLYLLPEGSDKLAKSLRKIGFSMQPTDFDFIVEEMDNLLVLRPRLFINGALRDDAVFHGSLLAESENTLYLTPPLLSKALGQMPGNKVMVSKVQKEEFLRNLVLPLSRKYPMNFNGIVEEETLEMEPLPRVYLSEMDEKFLLFKPKWVYGSTEVDNKPGLFDVQQLKDKVVRIVRKPESESHFLSILTSIHPSLVKAQNQLFYINFKDVLSGTWFITAYQKLSEAGFEILGFDKLKKFKYNSNPPNMKFSVSSGIDWFDVSIEVNYGDEVVPLEVLRQAFANGSQYVVLGDGSLGMLPEEWLKRFSSLFKMGKVNKETGELQIKKIHWTLIDQFYQQIDNEAILQELELKKEKLRSIEQLKPGDLPGQINASLRDYQVSGFQWLSMVHEMGWGGCLADDMGLGKTLQTITFLQYLQNQNPGQTHLIVCPTSLIFNWESELRKFASSLSFHIHYGAEREWNDEHFEKFDIIITSYGNLRSDIEQFIRFQFGYIILDESQAIKNPAAQISKAVRLLKAQNRLALSGTPVQNNTFDLYSQFDFLNPGLLGNQEFFRTEFANAIDKNGDKEKTELLRKLVHPFMLRRTKDQVAKDLPEKTEMVLWCEMDKKQRTIYNGIKEHYRKVVSGKIEELGMANSGIYILQGLLKLRQVCNSPAILTEEEKYPNVSIKLEELLREIVENTGNHKVLVFSQFTSMLELIQKELNGRKLAYSYLDGSVPQKKRKEAVQEFQENPSVRIFLISLMAGGVGLNLTAADYIYLVDPWWNPAAEQQAIDRTHRIGQTKKVFAYKMICKDSVEEKILELQKRKKALAADLITDDAGFIKKLSREDVDFLFG